MAEILVRCSAGTYIRSIAHDLGQALGCGALLSELRRVQISEFRVEDAMTIEQLEELGSVRELSKAVRSEHAAASSTGRTLSRMN